MDTQASDSGFRGRNFNIITEDNIRVWNTPNYFNQTEGKPWFEIPENLSSESINLPTDSVKQDDFILNYLEDNAGDRFEPPINNPFYMVYVQHVKSEEPETPVVYDLTYDKNTTEDVANMPVNLVGQQADDVVTIDSKLPTRTGYTFTNWNTANDGKGRSYLPSESYVIPENNAILYAQWSCVETKLFTLTFEKNTTEDVTDMPTNLVGQSADTVITIDSKPPKRTGYTFKQWNTEKNGTGSVYLPRNSYVISTNNAILYAQWAIKTTDNASGGNSKPETTEQPITSQPNPTT